MKENGGNSPAFPPRRTRPMEAVPAFFWSRVARARPLLQTWSGIYPNSWLHASLALAFYTAGVNRRCPLAGYIFNSGPECRQTPIHPLQRPDAVTSGCGVNVLRSLSKNLLAEILRCRDPGSRHNCTAMPTPVRSAPPRNPAGSSAPSQPPLIRPDAFTPRRSTRALGYKYPHTDEAKKMYIHTYISD